MSRGGTRNETEGSERTCIVTRRAGAPETMIRFVCAPDGTVTPDIRARLPGRGVWVGARAALVAEATKKRMFARGLKEKTEAPPDLADSVDRLLEADCLQMLALVNKAGGVICGFNKAADALTGNRVTALLAAHPDITNEAAALDELPRVRGAFSLVFMDDQTLYGARDANLKYIESLLREML